MSSAYHIGSINSGYRNINDGSQYDRYFPKPHDQDKVIIKDGEVGDTVDLMKRVVWKYIDDTKAISQILKGNTIEDSCKRIWNFLFHHIQYKLDKVGLEQLRRPARSWNERHSGIDCDCFAIFCSSILCHLKIPHRFRITKYGGDHYQHVYVIIPSETGAIIIDPVLSQFNYEKPFSQKKDFTMNLSGIDVAVLSGHNQALQSTLLGYDLADASTSNPMDAMYEYLVATRNSIAQNPSMIAMVEDPEGFIKMLDYAITYWHTDKRDHALSILVSEEEKFNQLNGLGSVKSFFQNVKHYVNNAADGIKTTARKVAKTVIKYNPLTVVARTGFLIAMKLNLRKMASKLKWGYASQSQAASHGIPHSQWSKSQTVLSQIQHLFIDKLQGDSQALKNAILNGRSGGLKGFESLGEPVTLAASIAAATPVIVAALNIMKEAGIISPSEASNTHNLSQEAQSTNESITDQISTQDSYPIIQSIPTPSPNIPMTPPNTTTDMITDTDTNSGGSGGIMNFVKKHPGVSALGAAVIAYGAYRMFKPTRSKRSLSGVRSRTTTKKSTVRRKPTPSTSRRKIKKVTLH